MIDTVLGAIVLIVAGVGIYVARSYYRKWKEKNAVNDGGVGDTMLDEAERAAATELQKGTKFSELWRKMFKAGAIVVFVLPGMYSCTALTAATDAYKAVTGDKDTVVHIHRHDTLFVKIECDSTR